MLMCLFVRFEYTYLALEYSSKTKQSIKKVVAAARKAGMSYGQYVAKMEAEGRK